MPQHLSQVLRRRSLNLGLCSCFKLQKAEEQPECGDGRQLHCRYCDATQPCSSHTAVLHIHVGGAEPNPSPHLALRRGFALLTSCLLGFGGSLRLGRLSCCSTRLARLLRRFRPRRRGVGFSPCCLLDLCSWCSCWWTTLSTTHDQVVIRQPSACKPSPKLVDAATMCGAPPQAVESPGCASAV